MKTPRSLLSPSFLALYTLITAFATAQTIWVEFSPTASSLNSTDDYLFPLKVGSNAQTVYLSPSLVAKETTVFSPKTCTPPSSSEPVPACITYRGEVFVASESKTYKKGDKESKWKQNDYSLFANGAYANDKIQIGKNSLDGFDFVLADACNMTSGLLGLGKDSVLLTRLKEEGKIASRSYGLHVGIDVMNHPDPVADPSWDEGRDTFASEDYTPGLGRRAFDDEDEKKVPVRPVHYFPGSITLGGYDKSKIDPSRKTLTGPIASDGSFKVKIKSMSFKNELPDTPIDFMEGTPQDAIIDADTPHFYFPETLSRWMGRVMGSTFGDPGVDFFHSYIYWDQRLGNLNVTLETDNNGQKSEITITVPPTVFYQPIGILKNFVPTGIDGEDFYSPFRSFDDNTKKPIVLGRSFLKAAYLYVNHETSQFQLSQVAYKNSTQDLFAVSANAKDINDSSSSTPSTTTSSSGDSSEEKKPFPVAAAAGGAGGAVVLIGAVILGFIFYRRKRRIAKQEAHSRIRHSISPVVGGRMELDGADPHPGKPLALQTLSKPQGEKFPPGPPTPLVSELPNAEAYGFKPEKPIISPVSHQHTDSTSHLVEMPATHTPVQTTTLFSPPAPQPQAPNSTMSPVSAYSTTPTSPANAQVYPPPAATPPANTQIYSPPVAPPSPYQQPPQPYPQQPVQVNVQPPVYPPQPAHQGYVPPPPPPAPVQVQYAQPPFQPHPSPQPSPQPQQGWGQQQQGVAAYNPQAFAQFNQQGFPRPAGQGGWHNNGGNGRYEMMG